MKTAYEQGVEWESCQEALEMRKAYVSQAEWWKACTRGDWLIWNLEHLPNNKFILIQPALKRAIDVIVDRAVKNYALHCGIPAVEQWAQKWLDGTDRSQSAAWAATWAAAGAAAGNAAWAATRSAWDAAWNAAWAAAWDATWAAEAAELKLQADDIHREIPEWPGLHFFRKFSSVFKY